MSDLLVARSDVGEFRKRYKWMALAAFLAFVAIVIRLFQRKHLNLQPQPGENIQQPGAAPATFKPSASYNYGVGGFLLAGSEAYKMAAANKKK